MNRFEKRNLAIDKAIREEIDGYKAVYAKSDAEDRDPTDDERLEIESHLRNIETLKSEKEDVEANLKTLRRVEDYGKALGPAVNPLDDVNDVQVMPRGNPWDRVIANVQKTIGEQFIESDNYKTVARQYADGIKPQFSTGSVEIKSARDYQTKAGTITELTAGGGLQLAAPVPQVIPGAVETLFQRLTFADLLLSGQATAPSVRYVVEGTATSGVAGVAEAAVKQESTIGFTLTDEPVKKLATRIVLSDEMLEDAGQVEAYINGRLTLFVQVQEELSLLLGQGTNDLVGVITPANTRGINTLAKGASDYNNADVLFRAMNGLRGSSKLEPDFIIMHPDNWMSLRLTRDGSAGTAGQYFGGGPFLGAYGVGQPLQGPGQVTGFQDYIWGKPVYVTSNITKGTALVGCRQAAQVWRKGGINIEATNSGYIGGADLFSQNLVAIRAEERLALAVYRPTAFCAVNTLS